MKKQNLIYDIGLHKGEDTDFYLKKGFEVVAFEADPDLAEECRRKFSSQIADQRLVIIEGAIVDPGASGSSSTVKFYRTKSKSDWGTVFGNWAERNLALGAGSEVIEVPTVNFSDCLRRYGVPYYMKIDIEGADLFCLRSLLDFTDRPDYVSIESEKCSFPKLIEEFELLERLGYSTFKAVQQADKENLLSCPQAPLEGQYVKHQFKSDSSGLFGRELPGRWKNRGQIIRQYRWVFLLYRLFGDNGSLRPYRIGRRLHRAARSLLRQPVPGWYDTHARHSLALNNPPGSPGESLAK
jgi:FkbM family methyltransferase